MLKSINKILVFLLFIYINAFADMVASDVDMQPAIDDSTLIVVKILSVLILLFSFKKILQILGKR